MAATGAPEDPGRLRSATATLRETTKWIITVSAGLASVLLAGLRFGDVGHLRPWSAPFDLAATGAGIALLAVGYVLRSASKVLSAKYDTLRQILSFAERQNKASSHHTEPTEPLINEIEGESDYLYRGMARSLPDLYSQIRSTNRTLIAVNTRTVMMTDEEQEQLRYRSQELGQTIDRVVDFADQVVTRERFNKLVNGLLYGGALIAIGIFVFALAVSRAPSAKAQITAPTPVTIYLTPAGVHWAERELTCALSTIRGVAVAGDLDAPEVAIPQQETCRAKRVLFNHDRLGVVVPTLSKP